MGKYHKRVITYDDKTQNYKIEVPELGLTVLGDTEMGALMDMRKEVEGAAKNNDSGYTTLGIDCMDEKDVRTRISGNFRMSPNVMPVDLAVPKNIDVLRTRLATLKSQYANTNSRSRREYIAAEARQIREEIRELKNSEHPDDGWRR